MTDIEEWLPIPGSTFYEVSNLGRVRSLKRDAPRVLKPYRRPDGYLCVDLRGDGLGNARVHRLVLAAFIGPCPDDKEARHLDGIRDNNRLDNLCYGTRSENLRDRLLHGTDPQASKTHCKHGHPFDEENTIRPSPTQRQCRTCKRRLSLSWYYRVGSSKRRAVA